MFGEFFRFDLRYQIRTPLLWIGAFIFALAAFGATSSDSIQIGGAIGNVHRNSPYVIVNFLTVFTVLGMFIVTVFIAGALLRDFEFGTAELFFATPMRKRDYLFGRFTAGIVVSLVIYALIALGMMLGTQMPWVDPHRLGPFSLAPYAWAIVVMVIPNLLFTGALLSLLAATTRSMLMVYLGILGFLVLWVIAGNLTKDIQNDWIASLLDPFGMRALSRMTRYWSAAERNTQLPPLADYLLANRALWMAIGFSLLGATYTLFKPQRAGTGKRWFGKASKSAAAVSMTVDKPGKAIVFTQRFNHATALYQFLKQLRFDTVGVLKSVPFLVMLAFGVFNLVGASTTIDDMYGTKVYPVTLLMLEAIQGSYTFLLVLIVTFYAGELVWKERGAKLNEVIDAMPVPNWVPLLAKLGAIALVVLAFMSVGVLTAIGYQLARGYTSLEVGLYVKGLLLEAGPFILMGALALVLQVLTNNKFLGYLAMILVLIAQMVLGVMHFDHNLYNYAGMPGAPYSDMNGYGHFLSGRLWFEGYWGLFAALLTVVAMAFWVRGTAPAWNGRIRQARIELHGTLGATLTALIFAFLAAGAWIFYNTNVRNEYVASDKALDRQADYEKKYRQYKDLPQPRITDVRADVDLFPDERRVVIRSHYRLMNKTNQAIPELHVTLPQDVELDRLDFAPAELTLNDKISGYRIYKLKQPMTPGAEMDFDFDAHVAYRGFTNDGHATALVYNGSFFNNAQYFLSFGYTEGFQIIDRNERRKRGLGEVPRMAKVEEEAARANTYLTHEADWISYDTTVSTNADQIALAPGYLQREWMENGRHYFHYKMDVPMLPYFAYLSAHWQVKRDQWHDIPIEIYYDAKHPYNIDRMIAGVKQSLEYYTAHFTPYQHKQVRIIEFPRYARFAQSFANTIPFSESIGFITDLRDTEESIDYVFYVTAHEVAHQWWAHQVIGADLQGSTMLSESLAQYSALMVMEKEYGREKMRRFLKYELDNYLRSRGGELVEELPLYRVENQPYIHYRKGSLVFYRLRDEIGEEPLNRALAKFLKDKGFQQPPYTTSRELLDYIRAETAQDKQSLITDLFEKIVFYDNRAIDAKAHKRDDGKYEVELNYEANKRQADGQGAETVVPIDDWIDIGVFAREPGAKESTEQVLYLQKQHITEGKGTLKLVVDKEPFDAGIDPYNKLIDRVSSDNRKTVTLQ